MKHFAALWEVLDLATGAEEMSAALERYFRSAPAADAAWALWFLSGRRLPRAISSATLRQWAVEETGLPPWLVEESAKATGDLAEAVALLIPVEAPPEEIPLARLVEERLLPLVGAEVTSQRECVLRIWAAMEPGPRTLYNKLLTGSFRTGAARALLGDALARVSGASPAAIEYRLAGEWRPTGEDFTRLLSGDDWSGSAAHPYPFCEMTTLEGPIEALGDAQNWQVEWHWEGLRAQLIHRSGQTVLWSQAGEILTGPFPEITVLAAGLPEGTVLDGTVLIWTDQPLPASLLQRRLKQRTPSPALLREAPAIFLACDLLEKDGQDWRSHPLSLRLDALRELVAIYERRWLAGGRSQSSGPAQGELFAETAATAAPPCPLRVSQPLACAVWEDAAAHRDRVRLTGATGLLIRRLDSPYEEDREHVSWWLWKRDLLTCNAVLIAAQPDPSNRSTHFTMAVWDGTVLTPIAKVTADLCNSEMESLDTFVREHTRGRFGPVRTVTPELVFELVFEAVVPSQRHKSSLELRAPRLLRWRRDIIPAQATTLDTLRRQAATGSAK